MDDQRIIGLIQAGKDQEAFKGLYAYLPKVEHLVRQNSGRSGDAKDIFQDALIIFHRRVRSEGFVLTSSIGTFLFAVCRNLWRDELRRRNKAMGEWKLDAEADEPADLTALLAREGEFKQAEQALKSLGAKCVDVLIRFYVKNEPLALIAKALGFSGEGAAKTRKYKCLEEARKRYRLLVATTVTTVLSEVEVQHP
ncbi:MAG: sigma-70 family RNA polymerase sigma factor [Flavobacteriales bacterium]|nr:sigma-70 family RNA polymerase sigma factor [Flavobacteriales bacterium]